MRPEALGRWLASRRPAEENRRYQEAIETAHLHSDGKRRTWPEAMRIREALERTVPGLKTVTVLKGTVKRAG